MWKTGHVGVQDTRVLCRLDVSMHGFFIDWTQGIIVCVRWFISPFSCGMKLSQEPAWDNFIPALLPGLVMEIQAVSTSS